MRNIFFIFIACIALVSCRTSRETVDLSVEHGTTFDSIYGRCVNAELETVTEIQNVMYDSVVTHITIIRYDTVLVDGSPVIKEQIEYDQVRISGTNAKEQTRDSIKATEVVQSGVAYKDTIQIKKNEQRQKKPTKILSMVPLLLFCIIILIIYVCIKQIRK